MMTNKTNPTRIIFFFFFCFLQIILPDSAIAQPGPPPNGPIDAKIRREVIDSLTTVLSDGYYDPSIAKKMVSKINTYYKSGRYDTIKTGRQYADKLTQDLYEVSRDKHLSVEYVNAVQSEEGEANKAKRIKNEMDFRADVNHGFDKIEMLPGNIGLLELRGFLPIDETAAKIDAAMSLLTDADALIIDLRYNRGGHPATVQYFASYLLDSKPVLFNTLKWRSSAGNQPVKVTRKAIGPGQEHQSWTLAAVPGPRYDKKPVYLLIGEMTASGGESFAYSLQALKRATIVGGTSAGAANPGGTDPLTSNFQVFIARGRPTNPITQASWEGVGVKPDVESSWENTLKVAYLQALGEIDKRGDYKGPYDIKELIAETKKELAELAKEK
jgi:C-terminal processing protease CtpA/Prc